MLKSLGKYPFVWGTAAGYLFFILISAKHAGGFYPFFSEYDLIGQFVSGTPLAVIIGIICWSIDKLIEYPV